MTCGERVKECLQYDTVKLVRIKSIRLGILHHVIQIGIFLYIVIYAIIVEKGYQKTVTGFGDVEFKIRGSAWYQDESQQPTVWDATDLVVPALESDAVFVATKGTVSPAQSQDTCSFLSYSCASDAAKLGKQVQCNTTHSYYQGECCVQGWCPVEERSVIDPQYALVNANNLKMDLRINGFFPDAVNEVGFNQNLTAVVSMPLGNVAAFLPGGVFRPAGEVLLGNLHWACNLDKNFDDANGCTFNSSNPIDGIIKCGPCELNITFVRLLDNEEQGFAFKRSNYFYSDTGVLKRTLMQYAGIRMLFYVDVTGGKFNFATLIVNFGSGLALMGLATLLADLLAVHCLQRREFYRELKFHEVEDQSDDESSSLRPKVQIALNKRPFSQTSAK